MNKLTLAILALSLSACGETAREAQEEVNVQRCIDMDGLPVRSLWDGRLIECIFKLTNTTNKE